jgi:hypothetical protein
MKGDQVLKVLEDLLGYDAIEALLMTADQVGRASLATRDGLMITLSHDEEEAYGLVIVGTP